MVVLRMLFFTTRIRIAVSIDNGHVFFYLVCCTYVCFPILIVLFSDAAAVEKSGTFILDDHALHVCFYHVVPKLNAKGAYGSTSGRECVNNFSPERSKNVSVCDNIYSDTNQFDERLSAATNMSMYLKSYTMTLDKPGYSEYLLGLKGQMFLKQIGISNTCSIDTSTSNHISERGQNTSEINALSKQNDDLYYTHSHFKRAGGNNPSRISKAIRVTEGVIATGKSGEDRL